MATQPEMFGPVLPGMPPLGAAQDPMMMLLQRLMQPQPTPQASGPDLGALLAQLRNDPQADQNKAYMPGVQNAANPFDNGFFNQSAASLSPEARQATQGNSAMTQWASRGAVPGVDPGILQSLMATMTPIPGPMATPQETFSDPFFMRRMELGPYQGSMFDGLMQGNPAVSKKKKGPLGSPQPGFNFGTKPY